MLAAYHYTPFACNASIIHTPQLKVPFCTSFNLQTSSLNKYKYMYIYYAHIIIIIYNMYIFNIYNIYKIYIYVYMYYIYKCCCIAYIQICWASFVCCCSWELTGCIYRSRIFLSKCRDKELFIFSWERRVVCLSWSKYKQREPSVN